MQKVIMLFVPQKRFIETKPSHPAEKDTWADQTRSVLTDLSTEEEVTLKQLFEEGWELIRESPMGGGDTATGAPMNSYHSGFASLLIFKKNT